MQNVETKSKNKKLLIEQIFSTVKWRESIIKNVFKGKSKILLKLDQEKFYRNG